MTKLDEATITSQGQVSIPKRVRQKLHLKKGDKIAFFEDGNGGIFLKEIELPVEFSSDDWKRFLDKTTKEPVTRVKTKAAALKHLDRLIKK